MRLLLSGGGNPEDVIPLDELFISQVDLQSRILYIPVAMEPHVLSYDLRANPAAVDTYGTLKTALAHKHKNDIDAYIDGKTAFIMKSLGLADI